MNFEAFRALSHTRRSIRDYTDAPVSVRDIEDIIDCARYAPSDTNSQTWAFVAIVNRERIRDIERLTWDALHAIAEDARQKGQDNEARLLLKSFGPYATAFAAAPAVIVCLSTPYSSKFREKIFDPLAIGNADVWAEEGLKSSSLAIQNLMLAAHAKGLATCPLSGPVLLAEKELRAYLNIPDNLGITMVVALGHPAVQPKLMPRRPVQDILTIMD